MIHFFVGTKAQLIKMAPVMIGLRKKEIPFRYVDSGQHAGISQPLRRLFELPEPDFSLRTETQDITSMSRAIGWYGRLWLQSSLARRWLRQQVFPGGGVCLIHGDTLSTLLGLQMARAAGLKIAHVEAGLRSHRLFDPFPEELIRIYCMRRAELLFAPSDNAADNLLRMKIRGRIVNIGGNTILDTLRLIDGHQPSGLLPEEPFALATCHRLETITNRTRLGQVVDLLNRVATHIPVVFVTHSPTHKYLSRYGLVEKLHSDIKRLNMRGYADFIVLLKAAHLVLTDGGSIQEECAALNKPCLILRRTTERPDGLGRNAFLWKFDDSIADSFLNQKRHISHSELENNPSPSAKIINSIIGMNF